MLQYGLIGHPLGHSFSAGFFSEKFKREGISARYDNFDLPTVDHLRSFVEDHPDLVGFNVTIPHKQAVIAHLDTLSSEAQTIGAVNVVRVERKIDGKILLHGFNSDFIGFTDSLRPLLRPHHRRAFVLGTGGASRAVIYGLHRLGISSTFVTRTRHAETMNVGGVSVPVVEYAELLPAHFASVHLIVNCSPLGMHPREAEAPALPYEALTDRHLLYDLIYNPLETRFLALGRMQGATIKNGLEMLHLQALASWKIWQE